MMVFLQIAAAQFISIGFTFYGSQRKIPEYTYRNRYAQPYGSATPIDGARTVLINKL
jgi:hypothetical protein